MCVLYAVRTVCAACIKTYSYGLLCNNTNSEKRRKFAKVENLFFILCARGCPASVLRSGVFDSLTASTIHIYTQTSFSSSAFSLSLSSSSSSLLYELSTSIQTGNSGMLFCWSVQRNAREKRIIARERKTLCNTFGRDK